MVICISIGEKIEMELDLVNWNYLKRPVSSVVSQGTYWIYLIRQLSKCLLTKHVLCWISEIQDVSMHCFIFDISVEICYALWIHPGIYLYVLVCFKIDLYVLDHVNSQIKTVFFFSSNNFRFYTFHENNNWTFRLPKKKGNWVQPLYWITWLFIK